MAHPTPSAPSDPEPRPIRAQYSGHVICADQSEDRIILGSAPPPYSEINKRASLDLDTLDDRVRRRKVKKARRRVRNIKIGAAGLVILLFLMSLM